MEEIPIGSHGPPKLVSNSALFQGEQPCESARAALCSGHQPLQQARIPNMTGNINPTSTALSRALCEPSKAKLYAVSEF